MAARPLSLRYPPIVEVVCGFAFEALVELDAMLVGQFWASKRAVYAKRELRPPVREAQGLTVSRDVGPIRCWLVSEAGEFVVQIQPDRFYFNWRRRGEVYPRFGDHDGSEGVLTRALREFDEFAGFCQQQLGARPIPERVELIKIDLVAFDSLDALSADVPLVAAVKPWTRSGAPEIDMRIAEQVGDIEVSVALSNDRVTTDLKTAARLETQARRQPVGGDLKGSFVELNGVVNDIFAKLLSPTAMARFEGKAS